MRLMLSTALAVTLALPAAAQGLVEIEDDVMVPGFEMTVDQLDDLAVTDPGGVKIGEIEEVLGTNASMPTALVVDFEDSATDLGSEDRVFNLDQLEMVDGQLVLRMPPASVLELPVWDD
jgi:hypothetical protein